jgi:hypothetical protein
MDRQKMDQTDNGLRGQCDQIGRIFTSWAIVYFWAAF